MLNGSDLLQRMTESQEKHQPGHKMHVPMIRMSALTSATFPGYNFTCIILQCCTITFLLLSYFIDFRREVVITHHLT